MPNLELKQSYTLALWNVIFILDTCDVKKIQTKSEHKYLLHSLLKCCKTVSWRPHQGFLSAASSADAFQY